MKSCFTERSVLRDRPFFDRRKLFDKGKFVNVDRINPLLYNYYM